MLLGGEPCGSKNRDAVEVIRYRAVVVARRRGANAKTAESGGGDGGESSEHAAAGDFHMRRVSPDSPDEP